MNAAAAPGLRSLVSEVAAGNVPLGTAKFTYLKSNVSMIPESTQVFRGEQAEQSAFAAWRQLNEAGFGRGLGHVWLTPDQETHVVGSFWKGHVDRLASVRELQDARFPVLMSTMNR